MRANSSEGRGADAFSQLAGDLGRQILLVERGFRATPLAETLPGHLADAAIDKLLKSLALPTGWSGHDKKLL
jgi:hypothetical protein